jgi:hypothetical protein
MKRRWKNPGGLGQVESVVMSEAELLPTATDVKAQSVRIADVLVFGPMMIYAGLGKATPQWVRTGMVLIGIGTIVYNLVNWMTIEKEKRAGGLEGMTHGPMHKASDLHRPINLLHQMGPQ